MAKKVPLAGLADAIAEIMEQYSDSVYKGTEEAVKLATKKGAQQVRQNSGVFKQHTGNYKAGWRSKIEKTAVTTTGIIYNAKTPGLPHLLEKGHAKVIGGRRFPDPVPGKAHIQPVQDELNQLLPELIKIDLGGGKVIK